MTENRSKQAGLLTTAEFIRFGFKSLIGIILARILLPAELGSYRQLFLIYTTFSILLLVGIPQSVLVFLPKLRQPESKREYITKVLNLVTILAFVFSLLILIFKDVIADKFHNPQLASLLILFAVYPLFMFVTQIYSAIMLGLRQPQKTAAFTIFSVVTDLVFVLGVAVITKNLHMIVVGVLISAFLQWCYAQFQLRKYHSHVSFDPEFLQELFKYSLPLGFSSIIGMLSIQLDKFVVSGFFRPEDFAVYSIGAMELPFISILANSVNSILLPQISSDRETMVEVYRAAVRKNALIIFPLCVAFFIFAKPLLTFLYTDQYAAAVPYFQVYLLILPIRIATFGIIFMAVQQTRYIMYNSILVLSLNLILNLILVRYMGMMGAAVATVIVTWISVAIYLYWIRRKLKLNLQELFPLWALTKTAVVVLLSAGVSILTLRILSQGSLAQLIALLAFSLSYLVFGIALKAILPYDVTFVKELISSVKNKILKVK